MNRFRSRSRSDEANNQEINVGLLGVWNSIHERDKGSLHEILKGKDRAAWDSLGINHRIPGSACKKTPVEAEGQVEEIQKLPVVAKNHTALSYLISRSITENDSHELTNELAEILLNAGACPNAMSTHEPKLVPLKLAIRRGDLELVRLLLQYGADPNTRNIALQTSTTPLHLSVSTGRADICEELILAGADVNISSTIVPTNGSTTGLSQGRYYVQRVCERTKTPYMEYRHGDHPLSLAVEEGNADIVKLLIENGAISAGIKWSNEIIHSTSYYSSTTKTDVKLAPARSTVYVAARDGELTILDMLLQAGANPDARCTTVYGRTPLIAAVCNKQDDCVRRLLEAGARRDLTSTLNEDALSCAAKLGSAGQDIFNLIFDGLRAEGNNGCPPMDPGQMLPQDHVRIFLAAIEGGSDEVVTTLLRAGFYNQRDRAWEEVSPLASAAYSGHLQLLDTLFEAQHGCVNPPSGFTAMSMALQSNKTDVEIVQKLIKMGVHVNGPMRLRKRPKSALKRVGLLCSALGARRAYKVTLSSGVSAEENSCPLLHYAVLHCGHEVVKAMLVAGADYNKTDGEGRNALQRLLVSAGSGPPVTQMVLMLVASGINVNHQDNEGRTPLHFVLKEFPVRDFVGLGRNVSHIRRLQDNGKLLIAAGGTVDIKDKEGKTALAMLKDTVASSGRDLDPEQIVDLVDQDVATAQLLSELDQDELMYPSDHIVSKESGHCIFRLNAWRNSFIPARRAMLILVARCEKMNESTSADEEYECLGKLSCLPEIVLKKITAHVDSMT